MDKYAVLGNPIKHSRSPAIHAMFRDETSQDMEYGALLCPLGEFAGTVDRFRAEGGKGLNITVPFKEDAFRYADILTDRARTAGAVNTLRFNDDDTVLGDNTDGAGFIADLNRLGCLVSGKRVLVMGAGGAARGILKPLLDEKPAYLFVANRTVAKALALADLFPGIRAGSYEDLNREGPFDILVNATSGSLSGAVPPLPDNIMADNAWAYDLMYTSTGRTVFLDWAQEHGAGNVSDGLGMLVGQAQESFRLWRGVSPDPERVLKALREMLKAGS